MRKYSEVYYDDALRLAQFLAERFMMKEARERADIDLDQLSAYTGIKPKNLENIEYGRFDATIDIIYNIAAALGGTFAFVSDKK